MFSVFAISLGIHKEVRIMATSENSASTDYVTPSPVLSLREKIGYASGDLLRRLKGRAGVCK